MRRVAFGQTKIDGEPVTSAPELVRCEFPSASLINCEFNAGTINQCSFEGAVLRIVNLRAVAFSHTNMRSAEFHGCDLRETNGLRLDDNLLLQSALPPYSKEPWSVLRRSYTGPKMAFNLIFLAMFFVPLLTSGFIWLALNRAEWAVSAEISQLKIFLEHIPTNSDIGSDVTTRAIEHLEKIGRCLREKCDDYSMWQLLLGIHQRKWWFASFTALLILYNVLRLALTLLVAPLRAEEDRSNRTPPRWPSWPTEGRWFQRPVRFISSLGASYGWLVWPHWFVFVFGFAALVAGAVNGAYLLTRVISLPS
jgi:hypothetical protein